MKDTADARCVRRRDSISALRHAGRPPRPGFAKGPPDGVVIRPFRPSDQSEARELILSGLQEHWGTRDPAKNRDLENIGGSYAGATFLVAWEGERLVGTGALVSRANNVAEVVRMSVAATERRRGIGRRILHELLRHAESTGVRIVVLETTRTWDEVIRFYQAQGFEITHHADGDLYFALDLSRSNRAWAGEGGSVP